MRNSFVATIWSILDRVWAQIVSFLIGIVLARLLTPEDYGLVGLSMVFIAFSNVFIDAGFSNALIRKIDRTDTDYSTAFYFNIVMGGVMYLILFLAAPWIADYFNDSQLILVTRIVSLTILFNSLYIVQNAILTAGFKMRQQAIINISAQIPSGLLAIFLAYNGAGVYALAVQTVLASFLRALFYWIVAKWRPSLKFSKSSMKYLWGFGSKLIGANMLGTVFNEIYTVLIGKFVGKRDLGFYSNGRTLSVQPENICNGVVQKVAVPLLAQYQKSPIVLREKYRELTKLITCVMTLISGILIVCAHPLILLIWGEKWRGTIPVFQLLILANVVSYVSYLSLVLLQIVNHTEYTLKLEFVKKPVFIVIIFIALKYGLYGLLWGQIVISLLATIVNVSAPKKYISYSYKEQFRDVLSYIVAWIIASACTFLISRVYDIYYVLDLLVRAFVMIIIYLGILLLVKDTLFIKYVGVINSFIQEKICRKN